MESGASPSAPAPVNGNLTTTSGMPIAPVYAGAALLYNFAPMMRSRRAEFHESQMSHRHLDYGTDFNNPYVPNMVGPRGGIDMNRHLAGTGVQYDDPLDLFKAQPNKMDRKPPKTRRPSRPADPNRQRLRGAAAYRKMNKNNADRGVDL